MVANLKSRERTSTVCVDERCRAPGRLRCRDGRVGSRNGVVRLHRIGEHRPKQRHARFELRVRLAGLVCRRDGMFGNRPLAWIAVLIRVCQMRK